MEKPYLSIIAASRNDNHGGDMLKRMRIFVNGLIEQCRRHKLHAELIMVDWNPPQPDQLLKDVLPKPAPDDPLRIRYIVVPNAIHQRYYYGQYMPLYQMIAKNAGIRRAKGEFILCTNVDLIFSDELMERLARKNLKKDGFYRANRCDIPASIEEDWEIQKQLEFAEKNIGKRLGKHANHTNLIGFPGWVYWSTRLIKIPNWILGQMFKLFLHPADYAIAQLDTMACGDFTLMSKEAWMDIEGYVEADLYSIHIDSLGLIAARAKGYKQYIFPPDACCYHIYHETGWESMNPMEKLEFLRKRPGYGWEVVQEAGKYALRHNLAIEVNEEDWGLISDDLKEIVF